MEVSVLSNGMAIGCSEHKPQSVSYQTLFGGCSTFSNINVKKKGDMKNRDDDGPFVDEYPESCAILVDKGYQKASEFCRVIHPKKKPQHAVMLSSRCEVK